ncbi:hypothetical protein HZH68_014860 [Vespula germanica]|uniref:Uncharacterized protein n=1 Tax=Vespula germanica TaxID=30212 RepID=A0A834JCG2_VESGE|nr:hypothetical protein HZH68_014860 [Vespula germanica]
MSDAYNISSLFIKRRAKQGHVITRNIVETCGNLRIHLTENATTHDDGDDTFSPFEEASFLNSLTSRMNDNGVFHRNVQFRDQNYIVEQQSRGALALDRVTSCVPRLVRGVKGPLRKSLFQPQRWSSSDGANDGAGGEGRRWSEVVGLGGRLTHKGGAR